MKNRFVIIIVSICVVIAIVAIVIIVGNMSKTKPVVENTVKNTENNIQSNPNEVENNGQDVVLTSKVGTSVLDKFYVPDIYSEAYFNELEQNGLSDKAKILYTFIQISKKDDYSNMLRIKEDYSGSYITQKDLETVAQKLFTNASQLKHQNIFGEQTYDSQNKNYVIVPMGFAGNSMNYTVEVPYKMTEFENYVEVYFYRLYATNIIDESKEESEQVDGNVYYDKARTNLALNTKDVALFDEEEQQSYLIEKINKKEIKSENLQKVKYTLTKTSSNYLIDKVEIL